MSELPNGWCASLIGDATKIVAGGTPPSKNEENFQEVGGIPWLTPADLSGYQKIYISRGARNLSEIGYRNSSAKLMPKGSVLFSSRAPIGYVAIAKNEISTNQGFKSFVLPNGLNSHYVYYYLKHIKSLAESVATGTTFKELSGAAAAKLPLLIAPENEQKRIADKLDTVLARVDACRERLNRVPLILKRFRQSVLAAATSGKLTEDWRKQNKMASGHLGFGVPRDSIAATSVEDANVNLPIGWSRKKVGDCVKVVNGKAFPSSAYTNAGIKLLRPGNLHVSGFVRWGGANTTFLNDEFLSGNSAYILKFGALVMNLTAQSLKDDFLGRVCLLEDNEPVLLNQRICSFEVTSKELDLKYLFFYFRSPIFREYVSTLDSGSLIKHMYSKQVLDHDFALPPIEEQTEIVRRVETLFAFADRLEARLTSASAAADKLTPALLAKAFRGELVPQDPNDEPASALLQRLAQANAGKEKAPRAKRGAEASKVTQGQTPA